LARADSLLHKGSELTNATKEYHKTASSNLLSLHSASETLSEDYAQDDTPTGATPRRRTWDYVDQWNLTKSRETVLKAWREQTTSPTQARSSQDEETPILDDSEVIEEPETAELLEELNESENVPIRAYDPSAQIKITAIDKKSVPLLGTLTDSRNVYTTRRLRRGR
jgi:kinesin family protein 11